MKWLQSLSFSAMYSILYRFCTEFIQIINLLSIEILLSRGRFSKKLQTLFSKIIWVNHIDFSSFPKALKDSYLKIKNGPKSVLRLFLDRFDQNIGFFLASAPLYLKIIIYWRQRRCGTAKAVAN